MLYDVIVIRPFDKVFTYSSKNKELKVGQVVLVPFGKKIETGIIWSKNIEKPKHEIREITKIIERIILTNTTIEFIKWITNYTLAPVGSVLKLFLINNEIIKFNPEKFIRDKLTSLIINAKKLAAHILKKSVAKTINFLLNLVVEINFFFRLIRFSYYLMRNTNSLYNLCYSKPYDVQIIGKGFA